MVHACFVRSPFARAGIRAIDTSAALAALAAPGVRAVFTASNLNDAVKEHVGEGGAIGAPPAVVNAVADALSPFGVTITRLPLGPSQVLDLIARDVIRPQP
jgi:CO/xanthine dehydrogenase Mo-binding subunit